MYVYYYYCSDSRAFFRAAGYKELVHRILLLRYQVTDEFSNIACGEAPDHKNKEKFVVPKIKFEDKKLDAIKSVR